MSEIKVTQMPEASNINDNDLFMIIQGGYNKKIPKELLGIPTKAHQVNVGTEVDEDYKVNLLKSVNILNPSLYVDNQYANITSGGTEETPTNNNYWRTGKQRCLPNTTYSFNVNSINYVCFYQKNGTPISVEYNVATSFTTPANCYYVQMSWAKSAVPFGTDVMINEGSTATEYTPFIPNQINVDNEKYSDTLNVGATEDSRSRVNVLHSKNLLDLQPLYLAINSSGTVISNANSYNVIIDTRNINTLYVKGDLTLLSDSTLRVGQFSSYPVLGVTGTRLLINQNRSIDTSSTNYVLLAFQTGEPSITTNWVNSVKSSFMIDTANDTYEPYIVPSIKVDNEMLVSKNVYSTNEVVIGEWLGKPLYRKCFEKSSLAVGDNSISTGLSIDTLVRLDCNLYRSNGIWHTLTFANSSNMNAAMSITYQVSGTISINIGSAITNASKCYVIMEYTKTTD